MKYTETIIMAILGITFIILTTQTIAQFPSLSNIAFLGLLSIVVILAILGTIKKDIR